MLRDLRYACLLTGFLRERIAGQDLVIAYDDELAGQLADLMTSTDIGPVLIVSRKSGSLVGLVARRDLLRVRTNMVRHEREREAVIRVLPRRPEYESTQV